MIQIPYKGLYIRAFTFTKIILHKLFFNVVENSEIAKFSILYLHILLIKQWKLIIIVMKSLYLKSFTRLINQIGLQQEFRAQLPQLEQLIIKKYSKSLKAKDMIRMPQKQLRTMLKTPCPVGNSFRKQEIQIFKKLRLTYDIQEKNVCSRCPNSKNCPFKDQPAVEQKRARLEHIIYFLMRLRDRRQSQCSILRWTSAYKVCMSLQVMLRDFVSVKKQLLLHHQIMAAIPTPKTQVKSKNTTDIYANRRFHLSPLQKQSKETNSNNKLQPLPQMNFISKQILGQTQKTQK